ncbi:MAG: hypothetical protein V2G42_07705 [bacterium JZ-2024 1]
MGEEITNDYRRIQEVQVVIGRIQGYIANKKYPMDRERLDGIWRKISVSVPGYVFEVHPGGDLHRALRKLKHANDLCNSRIFLASSSG